MEISDGARTNQRSIERLARFDLAKFRRNIYVFAPVPDIHDGYIIGMFQLYTIFCEK